MIFVLLRFNSNAQLLLYCSNIDNCFRKSSFDNETIAKSIANNKLLTFVSFSYGMSFIVSEDQLFSSNRPDKSFL